jgi:hypothetical protein
MTSIALGLWWWHRRTVMARLALPLDVRVEAPVVEPTDQL